MNNSIFAAIMIILASVCIFNKNTIEGFMDISGTNARHAYLPQPYKNDMSIRNFKPHGSTQSDNVKQLETFNYNPKHIRNNIQEVEQQFNMIEQYRQKNNISNNNNHNKHTSPSLPKHNLSETYIPQRQDYELSRGVGISSVTPQGYRNGAKPSGGADLLRSNIFENYTGFSRSNISGRGGRRGADELVRGTQNICCTCDYNSGSKLNKECQDCINSGKAQLCPGYQGPSAQQYVPMAVRRGNNADVDAAPEQFKLLAPGYKKQQYKLLAPGYKKQQYTKDKVGLNI